MGGILTDKYGLGVVFYISILFWIPYVLLWIPLLKTISRDINNLSGIMRKRALEGEHLNGED